MAGAAHSVAADGLPWPKSKNELKLDKPLGRGYFGEVWRGFRANRSTPVWAVKKIPLSLIEQHGLTEQMKREIDIMRSLRHAHIVELHFSFQDENHVYLGMEFAEGGGMFDLLSKYGKFSSELAARHFYQVCDALEYLHTQTPQIIHRDIKPENILLDKDQNAKLADFGWSNVLEGAVTFRATFCGTPDYLAPEMIRGEGHNESLDMWEMGVLLYEMTVGKSPFGGSNQDETCRNILSVKLKFPADLEPSAEECIKSLCKPKPSERLTAKAAKGHDFVRKFHAEAVKELPEDASRPSVEARKLRRTNEILLNEHTELLQQKAMKEAEMFQVSEQCDECVEKLKETKKERDQARDEVERLRSLERKLLDQLEELRQEAQKEATDRSANPL